jgi:hypothetical protein
MAAPGAKSALRALINDLRFENRSRLRAAFSLAAFLFGLEAVSGRVFRTGLPVRGTTGGAVRQQLISTDRPQFANSLKMGRDSFFGWRGLWSFQMKSMRINAFAVLACSTLGAGSA